MATYRLSVEKKREEKTGPHSLFSLRIWTCPCPFWVVEGGAESRDATGQNMNVHLIPRGRLYKDASLNCFVHFAASVSRNLIKKSDTKTDQLVPLTP